MSKNPKSEKMSENPKKNIFFSKNLIFFKKAILLVLPIEEISIRPELSSQPRFRIQGGGYRERYKRKEKEDGNSCV